MAVIKCSNCENEILDSEIVCPYCDFPISTTKEKIEKEKLSSALSGETVKIATSKDFEKEKAAIVQNAAAQGESGVEDEAMNNQDFANETVKLDKAEIQSDTLRKSLEERRARREAERLAQKKRSRQKAVILISIVVGVSIIVLLLCMIFAKLFMGGGGESVIGSSADSAVSSEAMLEEYGISIHSYTLTIENNTSVMNGYMPNTKDKPWKDYITEIKFLTISDDVDVVGKYSFDDLINLKNVIIAPSVSSVGEGAFYECTLLESVVFRDSEESKLKSIHDSAFYGCESLERIFLPDSVTKIGDNAFSGCHSLEKIEIGDSVVSIGDDAFDGCTDLVIRCYEDSYAHEYAKEHNFEVELIDEDDESEQDEENTGEEEENPTESGNPSESGNNDNTDNQGNEIKQPTKEERMAELRKQLDNAATDEERDRILLEIEKAALSE